MKRILFVLTAILLSVILVACSINVKNYEGTYKLKEIHVDGNIIKKGDKLWNLTYGEEGGMIIYLKGNGKGKISYPFHILAKLLIYKCSVCVAMECAVIVFLTQTDDISLTYQWFSTGHHIKIYAQFLTLCNNVV